MITLEDEERIDWSAYYYYFRLERDKRRLASADKVGKTREKNFNSSKLS